MRVLRRFEQRRQLGAQHQRMRDQLRAHQRELEEQERALRHRLGAATQVHDEVLADLSHVHLGGRFAVGADADSAAAAIGDLFRALYRPLLGARASISCIGAFRSPRCTGRRACIVNDITPCASDSPSGTTARAAVHPFPSPQVCSVVDSFLDGDRRIRCCRSLHHAGHHPCRSAAAGWAAVRCVSR